VTTTTSFGLLLIVLLEFPQPIRPLHHSDAVPAWPVFCLRAREDSWRYATRPSDAVISIAFARETALNIVPSPVVIPLRNADMSKVPISGVKASAYQIPTDSPESDGTLKWNKTTLVVAEITAGGQTGIGYSYADVATAVFIRNSLAQKITGEDAMALTSIWKRMLHETRNLGSTSIVAMGISAVDCALWDLKAKILDISLSTLLGPVRERVPVYGSGGFTSYSIKQLEEQLSGWAGQGIPRVKMKVGRDPSADPERVKAAREAIGPGVQLFVDANGAYSRKQALALAEKFSELEVTWFEEPVVADDLRGLRLVRDRAPAGMEIAAGEYGYDLGYFHRMLDAQCVDALQADVTRCSGVTGFLKAATLSEAYHLPLSAHCAPAQHVHVGCAALALRHIEYFHDHVRIECMLFDGLPELVNGELRPDLSRPGCGLEFKRADADKFSV
jgi:L-alanine-DL-glutamate epimerase-like enolase superfamily enzyme